jgi:hypothetical protein
MRGGARESLSRNELVTKFKANVAFGGWPDSAANQLQSFCEGFTQSDDLKELSKFRSSAE